MDAAIVVSIEKNDIQNYPSEIDKVRNPNQYPVILKAKGLPDFKFPIDPIISLSFRNLIIRRTVSKGEKRGTIKERWTEDDVSITITGVFINENENEYPQEVNQLREFFQQHKEVDVVCKFLNELDINKIAIEELELPPTKGINNQTFQIRAYSDDVFQLLIEG